MDLFYAILSDGSTVTTYREFSEGDCHGRDIFGSTLILLNRKGFGLQSLVAFILLFGFPQSIPQYIEVPPNIEAKRITSYFSAVLSYSSNPLLLKDDSKLLFFSGCWQAICNYSLYDPGY